MNRLADQLDPATRSHQQSANVEVWRLIVTTATPILLGAILAFLVHNNSLYNTLEANQQHHNQDQAVDHAALTQNVQLTQQLVQSMQVQSQAVQANTDSLKWVVSELQQQTPRHGH